MKLKQEKFSKDLLEKEIQKKNFTNKNQELDLKMQIKQLKYNLDKEKTEK